ncbi:MAG: NAD-dependent epimerase/dehydratase family protein [Halioglobus sp.]|nr:NAD-dependent epimerase/dehydratase family protein [Halioglobus sp.]
MDVLVTGGTGFIGSHVCDQLLERGHKVRVFSRKHELYRPPLRGVEYFIGDLADTFYLSEAMSGMRLPCPPSSAARCRAHPTWTRSRTSI